MRTVDRIQLLREIDCMARDHHANPRYLEAHGYRPAPCARSFLIGAAYGAKQAIEQLKGEPNDGDV